MVQHPHNDALIVTLKIGEYQLDSPMIRFNGMPTWLLGAINFEVHAGTRNVSAKFKVINTPFPYNAILGRPWLYAMRAVPLTLHQLLRFPTEQGIEEVKEDQV
ncbi:uncharacterized protein LOC114292557 [Camellia sinensis]|uniref:uncharacterized protein LOC114292557 n=1 Tax=Camellia sinensis TaxID=4442 RepID=UPI001035A5FA|nr:uncharacterized protein LOC114292557 [Camellia sinensis]